MTDQIDQTQTDIEETEERGGSARGRRMFLTGAGIAGAAAIASKAGVASANADGEAVVLGQSGPDTTPDPGGAGNQSTTTTEIYNTGTSTDRTNNAFKGSINDAGNNSHAILGTTVGDGHAIAGVVGTETTVPAAPVAATWGRQYGEAAATEGQNLNTTAGLAGAANGVKGIVESPTNGSHAVLGITNGAGHSVAGDTPADAKDGSGGPNTTAATWGRHGGVGAGIGGVSAEGYGGEFIGGKAHVRLIQVDNANLATGQTATSGPPTGDGHLNGELYVDGDGVLYLYGGSAWSAVSTQQVGFSDPQRAYDSREGLEPGPTDDNKGRIQNGETRVIDLTTHTAFAAGNAQASISVTVTATDDIGFLTVFNGDTADDARPLASQVTWGMAGTRTTNSFPVSVGADGTIKVYCGEGSCEFVVDVSG